MKKASLALIFTFLMATGVSAQALNPTVGPVQEEAGGPKMTVPSEIMSTEVARPVSEEMKDIEVREVEIRPSGEAVEMEVQATDEEPLPVKTFPLPTENRKLVEVEVKDLPVSGTRPVSIEQTPQGNIEIKDGKISATTLLPVKVAEQKISVEVKDKEEIIILPSQAVETIIEVEPTDSEEPQPTILDVELLECEAKEGPEPPECKVVYKIRTEEENKLLGLIPIKSKLSYEVDATSGKLLVEEKPWYLKLLPFLFT